ncbi:hypothetical protein ABPG73_005363 [Tetrahymena malaccensis]
MVRLMHGFGSSEILCLRSVISLLISTAITSLLNHSPYTNDKQLHKLLMIRCIIAGIGHYCFYQSIYMLDVTESVTISQTSPFWTTILAGLILKEKLRPNLFLTLIFSFVGILLIIQPTFIKEILGIQVDKYQGDQSERMMGLIFGLLQSFSISTAMIIVKKLSAGIQNTIIIHYAVLSTAIISGLDLIYKGGFNQKIYEPENLIFVFFIGLTNYSAQIIYSRAIMLGQASKVGPLTYSQILFGFIIEITIFHKDVSLLNIAGAILILLGNIESIKGK